MSFDEITYFYGASTNSLKPLVCLSTLARWGKQLGFVARTQAQRCKNYVFVVVCTILRCVLALNASVRLALALCS